MPAQGKRSDIRDMMEDIKDGEKSITALAEKYGGTYLRTYKGVQNLIDAYSDLSDTPYVRKPAPETVVFFGPTGTGKTFSCEEFAIQNKMSMGIINMQQLRSGWFTGWKNERIMLLDDFRGRAMEPHEFLNLLDAKMDSVPVKRGSRSIARLSHIFITSDTHPINWWPKWYEKDSNNWAQVKRRIRACYYVESQQKRTSIDLDEVDMWKAEKPVERVGFDKPF